MLGAEGRPAQQCAMRAGAARARRAEPSNLAVTPVPACACPQGCRSGSCCRHPERAGTALWAGPILDSRVSGLGQRLSWLACCASEATFCEGTGRHLFALPMPAQRVWAGPQPTTTHFPTLAAGSSSRSVASSSWSLGSILGPRRLLATLPGARWRRPWSCWSAMGPACRRWGCLALPLTPLTSLGKCTVTAGREGWEHARGCQQGPASCALEAIDSTALLGQLYSASSSRWCHYCCREAQRV